MLQPMCPQTLRHSTAPSSLALNREVPFRDLSAGRDSAFGRARHTLPLNLDGTGPSAKSPNPGLEGDGRLWISKPLKQLPLSNKAAATCPGSYEIQAAKLRLLPPITGSIQGPQGLPYSHGRKGFSLPYRITLILHTTHSWNYITLLSILLHLFQTSRVQGFCILSLQNHSEESLLLKGTALSLNLQNLVQKNEPRLMDRWPPQLTLKDDTSKLVKT